MVRSQAQQILAEECNTEIAERRGPHLVSAIEAAHLCFNYYLHVVNDFDEPAISSVPCYQNTQLLLLLLCLVHRSTFPESLQVDWQIQTPQLGGQPPLASPHLLSSSLPLPFSPTSP